jgi:hypothetical protein
VGTSKTAINAALPTAVESISNMTLSQEATNETMLLLT